VPWLHAVPRVAIRMTTISVSVVRDEADIAEEFVAHMLRHVDHMVIADHGSTDGTRGILHELAKDRPLTVIDERRIGYRQWEMMTDLAGIAGDLGADWVLPADADECWTVVGGGKVRARLAEVDDRYEAVSAPRWNHVRTGLDRTDIPFAAMAWRRPQPEPPPKVAFRWHRGAVVHQGNHGVTFNVSLAAAGAPGPHMPAFPVLEVHHFPVRSVAQLIQLVRNGAAAYAADPSLPEGWGVHWRAWGRLLESRGEDALHEVFRQYWWYLSPLDAGLVHDPVDFMEEPMASSSGAKKAETAKANAAARAQKLAALDNVQATVTAAERTAELARQRQQGTSP
jgi:hypothetical protein